MNQFRSIMMLAYITLLSILIMSVCDDSPTDTEMHDNVLTVDPDSLILDSDAQSAADFLITSNVSWTISDDAPWLETSATSGSGDATITVTATSANSSTSARTAIVTVSGSGISKYLSVVQEGTSDYENMILIPAGEFTMGSNSGEGNEKPVHTVYLDAYYIDKYEVTNKEYADYLNDALINGDIQVTSSSVTKDGYELLDLDDIHCQISYNENTFSVESGKNNYPVMEITWYGADAFAQHYGKRLPTEAEWEKAARGTDERIYPWGDESPTSSHCNFNMNVGDTTPVGHYSPTGDSPYGCCDMAGNVYEWCNDWYDSNYYETSPGNNPQGPEAGSYRVVRSGSWRDDSDFIRCADRGVGDPVVSRGSGGFRCAR